ncbi:MAG: 2-amino-4-hydroxy-6-hydroxymethyldihydropteridine diphosphokinase [Bacteroidales bacterium]|nr:2-amino-4-hydroxy-6-hydroxymethyldihydropteridine diphosphokinase [Bacteroidales bacterium]
MAIVYLGLGSNLGQKEHHLELAISEIEKQIGHIVARSAFYESAPWGFESSSYFLNACVAVETTLNPQECLLAITDIEKRLGRSKKLTKGYADRVIDVDILFYDQMILQEEGLTIPHPLLHQRLFVLNPLSEIAPDFIHPLFKKTIKNLLKEIS